MLVMLSGGRDSVCLLHMHGSAAMHMNYGLRPEADADEAFCRELCASLGVPLTVVRPRSACRGNVQAWARQERYAAALRITEGEVGVAHTASDQAETVLYRLLCSPGRRALLGMREREGRVVRPLLGMTRAETTAYCERHGLRWRDDPSNDSPVYARNVIRALLRDVHPAAEANVLRTLALLRDEAEVLDGLVEPVDRVDELRALPPALLRLTLQRMADEAGGRVALSHRVEDVLRGADLGGGLRSVVEHGRLRFELGVSKLHPPPAALTIPGQIRWGEGTIKAEWVRFSPTDGHLNPAALRDTVLVRTWRPGDRMRPLGLGGTKSLQDLFTDRKVPRSRRHRLPVVEAGGEIAWIPGVATGEAFRAADGPAVRLSWTEN